MSTEIRLKKLRGSGGYVMANVSDEQQMKGNLGGPDLFLAPIGRLDSASITKHFCNACEKVFEGAPKIEFENPNEEVAENLILVEKGQYKCSSCNSTIAEYRDFNKRNETEEIGVAKPLEPHAQQDTPEPAPQQPATGDEAIVQTASTPPPMEQPTITPSATEPTPTPREASTTTPQPSEDTTSVASIGGRAVYNEDANKIGIAKHVGIDSTQTTVLVIVKNDGTQDIIAWNNIRKIGEIILLGKPAPPATAPQEAAPTTQQPEITQGQCPNCKFSNKEGSKFCEECGAKLQ